MGLCTCACLDIVNKKMNRSSTNRKKEMSAIYVTQGINLSRMPINKFFKGTAKYD